MDTNTPIVISRNEDFLALAPWAVGFQIEESVVMLGCAGPRSLHARVDLPTDPVEDDHVAGQLVEAAVANDVAAVALLVYTGDDIAASRLVGRLLDDFLFAGVGVITALRVHDDRWFALVDGVPDARPEGVSFDVSNHPITVHGVLTGRVTHRSRAELAATLDPDPAAVARVEAALAGLRDTVASDWAARRVGSAVRRWLAEATPPDDTTVAELVAAVADDDVASELVCGMDRDEAATRLEFWVGVLRRTPPTHVASVAAMVAMAAWLAGDGALAWCAIDRCQDAGRQPPVARMVGDFLQRAVAPDRWGA